MRLETVARATARVTSVLCLSRVGLGISAMWMALAMAGYARLGVADLGDGVALAVEAASAGFLLLGSAGAIGRLRHLIVARGAPLAPRVVAATAFAALLAAATPYLAASYRTLSQGLEDWRETEMPMPKTVIVLGPGGRDIRLSGAIQEGAAERLDALLSAYPAVERIHLTSEGGLADEGQALGDVIARHAIVTYVADYCVSACTLAFVGGRERWLMRGAKLGFHAPYAAGLFGETFEDNSEQQRAAYLAAGVAPDFVTAALAVAASDIWIPDAAQLIAAHVATGTVASTRFPDSNLDGMATLEGARDIVLQNFPMLEAVRRTDPATVQAIAAWYLEAYRSGWSEGEVRESLERQADRAMAAVAPLTVTASAGASLAQTPAGSPPRRP